MITIYAFHSPTFLSGRRKVTTNEDNLKQERLAQIPRFSIGECLLALMNALPLSFLTQSSHILTAMSISFHLTLPYLLPTI